MREKEREGGTKGKEGLYKMPQIPTLPSKWPRSGVTFHFDWSNTCFESWLAVGPFLVFRWVENKWFYIRRWHSFWWPAKEVTKMFCMLLFIINCEQLLKMVSNQMWRFWNKTFTQKNTGCSNDPDNRHPGRDSPSYTITEWSETTAPIFTPSPIFR